MAGKYSESISVALTPISIFVTYLSIPFVWIPRIISKIILKIFGIRPDENDDDVTEEEIRMMVDIGSESGAIDDDEKEMIHNVFEFGETEIKEIMTPRIHVESLPDDCTYDELMNVYHDAQYSRYPIHDESFDEIIGVLNMKDLLFIDIDKEHFDVKKYMRDTWKNHERCMKTKHLSLQYITDNMNITSNL